MATTVTAADLTVSISETYSLNGATYGNTINKVFSSNGEVIQRIMSIAISSFTDIFHTSTVDGLGTIVKNDWTYFRITNLDDTNYITLRLYDDTDSQFFKVEAGESFMLMSPDIDVDTEGTTFNSFADVAEIAAEANTAAVDVEVIMVTT